LVVEILDSVGIRFRSHTDIYIRGSMVRDLPPAEVQVYYRPC